MLIHPKDKVVGIINCNLKILTGGRNKDDGFNPPNNTRRIKTEEKAKVVAAVWGREFIQFITALAILHQNDFKEKDEFFLFSNHPGAIHPILQIVLLQNS